MFSSFNLAAGVINVGGVPCCFNGNGQLVELSARIQPQYVQIVPQFQPHHGHRAHQAHHHHQFQAPHQAHHHQGPQHHHQFQALHQAQHHQGHQGHQHHQGHQGPQKQFMAPLGFSQTSYSCAPAGRYIPGLHVTTCPTSHVIPTKIGEHDVIEVRSAGPGWVKVKHGNIKGFMQV